jgi:hypothetical protein
MKVGKVQSLHGSLHARVAIFQKFQFFKLWVALILFGILCAWILPLAVENYREHRSMEPCIDSPAKERAARGGCTFYTRFDH